MTSNDNQKKKLQSINLRLDEEFIKEIDQFAKEYRFNTRTDSMRFLLALGLKYQKQKEDIENKDNN